MRNSKCLDPDGVEPYGHHQTGHIMPCCYVCVNQPEKDFPDIAHMYADHLKIENNDSIDDIINSTEWQEHYEKLRSPDAEWPKICEKFCGDQWR